MSTQSTMSFAERLATDQDFQTQAAAAVNGKSGEEATVALIAFGSSHGLDVTAAELLALRNAVTASDELSDESLEGVSGGALPEAQTGQLANIDLQNVLQRQQQTLQTIANVSKMLHDTKTAVIRKIG